MDGGIQTQLDDLLASLKAAGGKPVSVRDLSSATGLSQPDVAKWLSVLEKSNHVQLNNRLEGVYASWAGPISQPEKTKPYVEGMVDATKTKDDSPVPSEISDFEQAGKSAHSHKDGLRKKHLLIIESADAELASAADKLVKIDKMLSDYQKRKAELAAKSVEAAVASVPVEIGESESSSHSGDGRVSGDDAQAEESDRERAGIRQEEIELVSLPTPKEKAPVMDERPLQPEKLVPRIIPISRKTKVKIEKIKKAEPVKITSVSLQFSEKLAKQMQKIVSQSQEIEKLRMQKEQLLTEHYMPLQRKLECEIETISERVLRMEKGVINMQGRAAALPSHVSSVEKLQVSTIKAHAEMRKAYDEASVLIEESTLQLSDEREKMEMLANQSREEIYSHQAKTAELQKTLARISEMENEAESLVTSARAALAEQAEKLAVAESHSRELSALREEIADGVDAIKKEVSSTKGLLTTLEKEMGQMRHVEEWANTVRQDYEAKMLEIDEYIRTGNHEFDTLRESVEANFVRRYLHELRTLTDSYSFEFNQAKNAEETLDEKISREKRKLEQIIDNGRQLAYIYEAQAGKSGHGPNIERYGATFSSMSDISSQRTELQTAIAQLIGKRAEHQRVSVVQENAKKGEKKGETRETEKPVFAKKQLLAPKTIDKVHLKPAPAKIASKIVQVKHTSSKKAAPVVSKAKSAVKKTAKLSGKGSAKGKAGKERGKPSGKKNSKKSRR